jgi:hypothetical protein
LLGAAHDGGLRLDARRDYTGPAFHHGGGDMKNPLDSLWGTVISGLVLTVVLYFVVKSLAGG